ncbi:hypothetical protein [Streptomyces sp. NPDC046887]|uniref:hypothetical protein n=1 Tax=Streptomyces sp. NPDC046887 TaxID=3155472 RepID=UPI003405F81D
MTRQIAAAAAARAARAGAESRSRTSGSSARAAGGNGALGLPLVRALAGLGPAAAPYADRLRALTSDREHWVRVEAA